MIKHESSHAVRFRHWLLANPIKFPCWFEIKDSRGKDVFPLREWKQEQRDFAESLKYAPKGVLIRTDGTTGLPDYKYAYKEPTIIVIFFPKGFVLIEHETLAMYKPKTITWEKAKEISIKEIPIR